MNTRKYLSLAMLGVALAICAAGCTKSPAPQAQSQPNARAAQPGAIGAPASVGAMKTAELPPDKRPGAAPDPDEPKK